MSGYENAPQDNRASAAIPQSKPKPMEVFTDRINSLHDRLSKARQDICETTDMLCGAEPACQSKECLEDCDEGQYGRLQQALDRLTQIVDQVNYEASRQKEYV